MAGGIRPAARPGGRAGRAGDGEGRAVAHAPERHRADGRPGADGRRRSDRALRPLRARPPVLARPHGPLAPPARRAARAGVPRLVRDLQRRGRLGAADARPDQRVPRQRPRQLQDDGARDHAGPGDDPVPRPRLQPQGRDQRELRARADGAVHARRRPRGLHRERRARAGALAQRLGLRLERPARRPQLPLGRGKPLGPGLQDRVRQDRALDVGGRRAHGRRAPEAPVVLRREAVELLRPDRARRRHGREARAALRQLRLRDPAGAGGDPVLAAALHGAADGQAADGVRGRDAARPQARDHLELVELGALRLRPGPLLPARRLGLGRQALARHQHHARALGGGRDGARGRHRRSERGLPAPRPRTRRSSRRASSGARRRSRPAAWPRSTRSPTTRSPPTPPTGSARRARTPCGS